MLSQHGGNLDAARRRFPGAPEPWIDLSTGINPFPYPIGELPAQAWTRLPEPAAVARLEGVAASAYGAPAGIEVVAASGTQCLIQWLPRVLPARRVGILGPTYGEYAAAWRIAGAEVEIVGRLEALAGFDVAMVCNPNNPDGRASSVEALLQLAASVPTLIVDEAFADLLPDCSLAPRLPPAGIVVLRSFGKTYGLAGLRLGFAVCAPATAQRLRAAIGPWAISGPAAAIGARALGDAAWLATTAPRLADAGRRLDRLLTATGWEMVGGTLLFRLARQVRARERFETLGRGGILARPFDNEATWLRFGIPADDDWERLEAALQKGAAASLFTSCGEKVAAKRSDEGQLDASRFACGTEGKSQ